MITGERIRATREDKDILQQELSIATGINVSVLNRIEQGSRQVRDDEIKKNSPNARSNNRLFTRHIRQPSRLPLHWAG